MPLTSQLPAQSARRLALLIDPQHLEADAIAAARAEFGDGDNRRVVLDEVLSAQVLPALREVAARTGSFADNLKLSKGGAEGGRGQAKGTVDAAAFAAARDDDRFINQRKLVGPAPGYENSASIRTEKLVRAMLSSEPMHEWLQALSGIAINRTGGINYKLHGPGSLLTRHSDVRKGRKLCAVIYLHEDWHADFAGRFLLHRIDGSDEPVDPLPNRMILFEASEDNQHSIEPLGQVPGGWQRKNYSVWFY